MRVFRTGILILSMLGSIAVSAQPLTLKSQEVARYRDLDGTVQAVNQSTVSAQVQATVTGIYADVGDEVDAGTLLVKLDDTEIKARLEQARASVSEAKATLADARSQLARTKKLFARKMTSKADLDKAQADAEAAQARLDAARAQVTVAERQLSYTRITAPYAGLVVSRHVELGETVQPGTPLLTGLSLTKLRVSVRVPQALKGNIARGTPVDVRYHGGDLAQVTVSRVSPLADPQTHDFEVRAALPDGITGVLPGEAVKVRFPIGEQSALLIPTKAIMHQGELTTVYVLNDKQQPVLRQVRLGRRHGDEYEVLAGLREGETISTTPASVMSELDRKAVNDE